MDIDPIIIFEDEDLLILDKPAGITVNRSDTTRAEQTVQDWVEGKFDLQSGKFENEEESDFYKRAGIVHRIDKETSGILLVAKNQRSFEDLQRQFKERLVSKSYTALVHGNVLPLEGEIRVPVARLPWNRKRFGVLPGGKDALTKYKVLGSKHYALGKKSEVLSLLELYPHSGRTHQIRVHLKYYNHPIFADALYAGRKTARDDRVFLNRVFLHASKIGFAHPRDGKYMHFESQLPKELHEILLLAKG